MIRRPALTGCRASCPVEEGSDCLFVSYGGYYEREPYQRRYWQDLRNDYHPLNSALAQHRHQRLQCWTRPQRMSRCQMGQRYHIHQMISLKTFWGLGTTYCWQCRDCFHYWRSCLIKALRRRHHDSEADDCLEFARSDSPSETGGSGSP